MQKVCCDADMHASPQLPPRAALSCFPAWGSWHVTKHKVPRPDAGVSISLHVHTARMFSHTPWLLPLCLQTLSPPSGPRVRPQHWAPVGNCAPLVERIPARCEYPLTLGKKPALYTSKPPRVCPMQVWDPASHVMPSKEPPHIECIEGHSRAAVFLNQTRPQTPSQINIL